MKPIISVEDLSKQYRIGERQAHYETLRESLMNAARAPFKRLRSNGESNENTIWALKDVSFEVMPGEVIGVIGRNGAGKSTLLKILSRVTEPTAGAVDLYGRVGSLLEVGTGFHPELTGRENIFLNGTILGMSKAEIERQFDQIVEFAEIGKFLDTPVKRYSSGMHVRLAFAVAAHLEPEILLIDEVLAVGDAAFQKKCIEKVRDVAGEGRTVLFVSHNMGFIAQLCNKSLWLEDGQIEMQGATDYVISRYLSRGYAHTRRWERQRPDRDNLEVTLTSAQVTQDGHGSLDVVRFDRDFQIEIEYRVNEPLRDVVILARLTDTFGTIIFDSCDIDTTDRSGTVRTAGKYKSICNVTGSLLKPGRYFISVWTFIAGVKIIEVCENILTLEVSEIGYSLNSGRSGVITPMLNWDVMADA